MTLELPVKRASEIELRPAGPEWLVRPIWGKTAVGIIGGHPKCGKSHFGLDLATSVASNTHCLARFPTQHPGPALVYLAEDDLPLVRARIEAICRERGLSIERLDLHVIASPVLRLDTERDQDRLRNTLDRLKPHLLLLDPLVRIHRLDENSASEISGLLGFLREINRTFACAVCLVHHASKKHRTVPGHALRGSSDIYAWGDSMAYLRKEEDHLLLTLEHRAAPAPAPIRLDLVSTDDGASHLRVRPEVPQQSKKPSLPQQVLACLKEAEAPMTRSTLRESLGVRNARLGEALKELESASAIRNSASGWLLENTDDVPARWGDAHRGIGLGGDGISRAAGLGRQRHLDFTHDKPDDVG